jgi:hypothetical protein
MYDWAEDVSIETFNVYVSLTKAAMAASQGQLRRGSSRAQSVEIVLSRFKRLVALSMLRRDIS